MNAHASAYDALAAGDAAIVCTDTVYGLAAVPGSAGEARIFELKQRPSSQPLPWLVGSGNALLRYGRDVPAYALTLARTFWPGPLTLVVAASGEAFSHGALAADGTLALRCPDEPALLALLARLDCPLACTSANVHGAPAPAAKAQLEPAFAQLAGYDELPEACAGGRPSSIVDCTGELPVLLREGPVPFSVVLDCALFGVTLADEDLRERTAP